MIRRSSVAMFLAGTSAALAQSSVDEARVEQLVALICDNGGSMETSQAAQILPANGYTMEETQAIVATLERRGQVVPTSGMATLKLTKASCK